MSALNALIGAVVVFVFVRAVCEPKLRPGREIWNRVLGLEPADAAMLAGVRFIGTFSLLVGIGAGIGVLLTWWVESLDLAAMGSATGQDAVDRVERLLAWLAVGESVLSRLGVLISIAYVVLFAVGLLFWSMRSTRDVRKRLKTEVENLRKLGVKNKLPPMAPDERMRHVGEAIAAALAANADIRVIEDLFNRLFQYDIVRRLDPGLLLEVGDRLPGSRIASILRFLISTPLSHQVNRAGRIVSALIMVTMVPASLVIVSADLDKAIDKKQLTLKALAGALTLERGLRAETPPDELPSDSPEEKDQSETEGEEKPCEAVGAVLPADVCTAAAEFAAAFEAVWGTSLLDRSETQVRARAEGISDARRAWARRQVLLETVASRTATVNVAEVASGTSERQIWSRDVMDAGLKARTGFGPVTNFGKLAGKIFAELAPSVSGPIVLEVTDRPLTLRELAARVASAGVGLSIDSVELGGTEPTLEDKLLSGTLKETLATLAEEKVGPHEDDIDWLRRGAELAAMNAASRVQDTRRAAGAPMRIDEDTMRMVRVFVDPDLAKNYKGMIDKLTRLEFSKRKGNAAFTDASLEAVSSSNVDWAKVGHALRQYREATKGEVGFDSLASYSSVFPGIEGQRAQTQEAQIARILDADLAATVYGAPPEVLGHAGGREGLKAVKATEMTPVALDRLALARSFPRLSAYHRVGGVLIGREPNAVSKGPDLVGVDFTFDEAGDGLTIHLIHANGTKTDVGPYDPAVAHLALAYAADGRPVTVTIMPASPLPESKILLHPALLDTEVGCHAIQLDLFVNQFGSEGLLGARRHEEIVRNRRVVELYRQASTQQLLGLLRAVISAEEMVWNQIVVDPSRWVSTQQILGLLRAVESAKEESNIRLFPKEEIVQSPSDPLASPSPSSLPIDVTEALMPLRQRPRLFDPKLVEILEGCSNEAEKQISVSCVKMRARQAGKIWSEEPIHLLRVQMHRILRDHDRILGIVPNSGVREDAYDLDEDLRFAQVPRDIWSGPLRFVVLNNVMIKHSDTEATKSEPWEFEAIQERLQQTVLNAVRVRPEALRTLRVMQQFTVAQRLFRAAFQGRLGERFPVERLVEIIRETAAYVDFDTVRTDRWLLRTSPLDGSALGVHMIQLREALGVPTDQEVTCLGANHTQ